MNTPTPITDAHKGLWTKLFNLAHDEIFDDFAQSDGPAHQLIADSEAEAVLKQTAYLKAMVQDGTNAMKERDQLRDEVERLTKQAVFDGDHIHTLNAAFATRAEVTDANARAERAERAEAQLHALRLVCGTTDANKFETWTDRANARAEKAEAELAAAKERLRSEAMDDYASIKDLQRELATERARLDAGTILLTVAGERVWHCGVDLRAAIDAAMKEGAK